MKLALTGGSGSVGRAIATEALKQGHEVVSIDRVVPETPAPEGLRYVEAEVADYDGLVAALEGCDKLIHMAAIPAPGRHPDHVIHNNNVVGSYNALRAAVEVGMTRICQASSVNAIGLAYSRAPRFDYFPVDEAHPNYSEEPYSLSKWICEQQADSFVRRYEDLTIASMRFHWVVPDRSLAAQNYTLDAPGMDKHLWAYTGAEAAARACLLSIEAPFKGHEVFYIVAPDTTIDVTSREAAARHFPQVAIRGEFAGRSSFFTSEKAERILGWKHDG
jgi:UDP-glucose 4-epimerase